MAQTDVCPEKLRFTQDSIKNTFKKPYDNRRIDDAVDQIGNKQLDPGVLMPLNVVNHRRVLWSLDNRRLWVLRKAGVPTVKVIWVPPNHSKRSEEFFSTLNDKLARRYSGADYFPRVRGSVRSVSIGRATGIPPALLPPNLKTGTVSIDIPISTNFETNSTRLNAGATQANRTPSQRPLRDITVRSNIPPPVSPLPNVDDYQKRKSFVPNISNTNSGPGGKKGSDSLWGKILDVVNCAMEKGFRFFRSFDPCNEKVVRLGMNSLVVLGFCFALRQAYNLGKGSVDSKLENVLRAENGSGFFEYVDWSDSSVNLFEAENVGKSSVSDENTKNNGYLGIVAVKAIVGVEKMTYNILSKTFCFLWSVVQNCVDLSKRVVVCSGRKALYPCSVILRECFGSVHFITCQAAVSFGRMGIRVSEFCLEQIWELLRFIKCQAFGLPVKIVGWSVGKLQDALSFYMNEIKEFLCKVICSPQIALSFCLNKVKELAEGVIGFCLNKMKEFLGLQGF